VQAAGTDARDNTEQEISVEGGEQKKWMKIAVQLSNHIMENTQRNQSKGAVRSRPWDLGKWRYSEFLCTASACELWSRGDRMGID
jgi:hypothetical protein